LVAHRHPASQVDYTTPTHPEFVTVADALDFLFFVPMSASMSGGFNAERGQVIASVPLSWSFSKAISAQTLTGPGVSVPALADRSAVAGGPFAADASWGVQGVSASGTETPSAGTSLRFLSRRHWGVSAAPTLDDAALAGLAGSELATSRQQSRSLSASGEFLWFAWPAEFGFPEFWVGGLLNTAWVETIRTVVNGFGYARSYRLYRSQFLQNGSGIGVEVR
jgi:hypothetical protein